MSLQNNIEPIIFDRSSKKLQILDQTLLPSKFQYVDVPNSREGYVVIKEMMVRGAPLIAAVGCLSLVAELNAPEFTPESKTINEFITLLQMRSEELISARPTAVNLRNAIYKLNKLAVPHVNSCNMTTRELIKEITHFCISGLDAGLALNKQLAHFGAERISMNCGRQGGLNILTHCNTGSLATVGHGTALGVIRTLYSMGRIKKAYCTETRPYNQGSRLTAWELVQEKIPATLIADSTVACVMEEDVDAVVVGADCVAANGDTANKIGTLQIAIVARHYNVPFYVAAPSQSIDLSIKDRSEIVIEFRQSSELRKIGDVVLAPDEVDVLNPCFDVTSSDLITGIITEYGVFKPNELKEELTKSMEQNKILENALF